MIPPQFAYFAPTTLHEALTLLHQYGSEAKLLSGGQSLIPLMKLRLATPAYLIDINRIPGLDHLQERNGVLSIGALTREADLERSELVRATYPIVRDTARSLATLSCATWPPLAGTWPMPIPPTITRQPYSPSGLRLWLPALMASARFQSPSSLPISSPPRCVLMRS